MTVPANPSVDLNEPPASTRTVLIVGLVGVGLALFAFLIGVVTHAPFQGFEKHWADGPRMILSVAGLIVAGCAASMRPNWYGGWLCCAAAGFIGYGIGMAAPLGTEWYAIPPRNWYAGVPNSWDSMHVFFLVAGIIGFIGSSWTGLRLEITLGLIAVAAINYVAREVYVGVNDSATLADRLPILLAVAGGLGLLGALRARLPRSTAPALILAGVAFHFAGILSAITSPPPTPWFTDQYWKRVARPYLQFAYMNNAYQFYSPDPGPATELWVCFEYDNGDDPDAPKDCEWQFIPRRETHFNDPLGLSFYRRLSITENVAQYAPVQIPDLQEHQQVLARRNGRDTPDGIPRRGWNDNEERRLPNDLVTRQLLPSYARHLAAMSANPDKKVKTVKIYRTLHMLVQLPEMRGYDPMQGRATDPVRINNPKQYLPYFQGEFDPQGNLIDPIEPLLYWLVPITQDRVPPRDREEYKRNGGFSYYYTDYVSKHAGCPRPIQE